MMRGKKTIESNNDVVTGTAMSHQEPKDLFQSYVSKGRFLFRLSLLLLVMIIALGFIGLFLSPPNDPAEVAALSLLFFPLTSECVRRYKVARDRLGFVEITEKQFLEVFSMVEDLLLDAGLEVRPKIFMLTNPAIDPCSINPGLRESIVLGSDFFAGCKEKGNVDALRFMLAHQVGHFVAGHNKTWNIWISSAIMGIPFLKTVFIRNLEFTADIWAAIKFPRGASVGLALCTVGKDNFDLVDSKELVASHVNGIGFLGKLARWITSTVPAPERMKVLGKNELLAD